MRLNRGVAMHNLVSHLKYTNLLVSLLKPTLVLSHPRYATFFVPKWGRNKFYFLNSGKGGFAAPLASPCKSESECELAPARRLFVFVAVTTKPNNPQGFSLNGFPPAVRAPPIYRTAQARLALDRRMVLQLTCSYADWRHPAAKAASCHHSAN